MPEQREMPMFPLGAVLFPYALLPLHVFEPRYRLMTRRAMQSDQQFGVVLIERGSEVGGGDARFGVGTLARIVQANELPDGRFALVTVGLRRIRVERWLPDDPYPQAVATDVPDEPPDSDDHGLRDRVEAALGTVYELVREIDASVGEPPTLDNDPLRASYEAAAAAPIGPLDAQRLLEADHAADRLSLLARMLDDRAQELRTRRTLE
jgi:Lon protease-like protein